MQRPWHSRRLQQAVTAAAIVGSLAFTACGSVSTSATTATDESASAPASGHMHEPHDASAWDPAPTVSIEVTEDAKSGWNVRLPFTGITMAPEHASSPSVDGEGHMHLYVDDIKVARVYGEWYHLDGLAPGEHEVRVELNANDHSPLSVDGAIVEDRITINESREPAAATTSHDSEHDHDAMHGDSAETKTASTDIDGADHLLTIDVSGGDVSGDTDRQKVPLGETVAIVVSADTDDQVHVHGYEYLAPVTADTDAVIVFDADVPGLFEVELEGAGVELVELQVQ